MVKVTSTCERVKQAPFNDVYQEPVMPYTESKQFNLKGKLSQQRIRT